MLIYWRKAAVHDLTVSWSLQGFNLDDSFDHCDGKLTCSTVVRLIGQSDEFLLMVESVRYFGSNKICYDEA